MALFSFKDSVSAKAGSNGNGIEHGEGAVAFSAESAIAASAGTTAVATPPPLPAGPASSVTPERQAYLMQMRVKIHQKLVERLNVQNLRSMPINVVRQEVRTLIRELYQSEKGLLSA